MKLLIVICMLVSFLSLAQADQSCAYLPSLAKPNISFCQTSHFYEFKHKSLSISWQANRADVESYLKTQIENILKDTSYPKIKWAETKIEGWVTANSSKSESRIHFIFINSFASFQLSLNKDIKLWPSKLSLKDIRINMISNTPSSNSFKPTTFVALLTQLGDLKYKDVEKWIKSLGGTDIEFEVVFPMVFFKMGKGFDEQSTMNKIKSYSEYDLYFDSMGLNLSLNNFTYEQKAFEF